MRDNGKRFWITIILLLILALCALFVRVTNPAEYKDDRTIYVKKYDVDFWEFVFGEIFKEPFETILIIFKDGKGSLTMTTQEAERINADAWELRYILNENKRKIEEILFIVHNHLTPARPTFEHNHFWYQKLKMLGFKGVGLVYYPHSKRVEIIK